jgi:hypothetical protein
MFEPTIHTMRVDLEYRQAVSGASKCSGAS